MASRNVALVALLPAAVAQRPMEQLNTQCLLYNGLGCHTIKDQQSCLNSRDGRYFETINGRRIRGEPCVWCDGESCSDTGNLCEAYDMVIGNPSKTPPTSFVVANCNDYRTVQDTMSRVEGYSQYTSNNFEFHAVNGGENQACRGISAYDDGKGLTTVTGQQWSYSMWTASSLDQCKAFCGADCVAVEFNAANSYCETWVDSVRNGAPATGYQCFSKKMDCLKPAEAGCSGITSKDACIASKDGRQAMKFMAGDVGVYDSPCAWCADGACHDGSSAQCETLSLLVHGHGKAFNHFYGWENFEVATCIDSYGRETSEGVKAIPMDWLRSTQDGSPDMIDSTLGSAEIGAGSATAVVQNAVTAAVSGAASDTATAVDGLVDSASSKAQAAADASAAAAAGLTAAGAAAGGLLSGQTPSTLTPLGSEAGAGVDTATGSVTTALGDAASASAGSADAATDAILGGLDSATVAAGPAVQDAANSANDAAAAAGGLLNSLNPTLSPLGDVSMPPGSAKAVDVATAATTAATDSAADAVGVAVQDAANSANGAAAAAGSLLDGLNPTVSPLGDVSMPPGSARAVDVATAATTAATDSASSAIYATNSAIESAAGAVTSTASTSGDASKDAAAGLASAGAGIADDAATSAASSATDSLDAAIAAVSGATNNAADAASGAISAASDTASGVAAGMAAAGAAVAAGLPTFAPFGGKFIRAKGAVDTPENIYWLDSLGKHALPAGITCRQCGCNENVQEVEQSVLDGVVTSDTFHCIANAAPAIADARITPAGRFIVAKKGTGASPPDTPSTAEGSGVDSIEESKVFWQDPVGTLHPVGSEKCDCCKPAEEVDASHILSFAKGSQFKCEMVGTALGSEGVTAVGEPATVASAEVVSSSNAASSGSSFPIGTGALVGILLTLCAGGGIAFFACKGKNGKRSKRGLRKGHMADEEEAIMDDHGNNSASDLEVQGRHMAIASPQVAAAPAGSDRYYAQTAPLLAAPSPVAVASQQVRTVTTVQAPAQYVGVMQYSGAPQIATQRAVSAVVQEPVSARNVFDQIDADHDGVLTKEEWQRYAFNAFDANHDGRISGEEFRAAGVASGHMQQ